MIFIQELNTLVDFQQLQEGDYVAVKFKKPVTFDTKEPYDFKVFQVYKNLAYEKEIVLQKKNNIYFSYEMFVEGTSNVESVTLISESKLKLDTSDLEKFKNEH